MSDYARANTGGATHFGDKDSLSTGDADKVIVGADYDTEFNAIVTAVASKYDSSNLASQAQAEGLSLDTVLITPHSLNDVLVDNAGIAKDIQQLTSPGADRILFWDNGAGAAAFLTPGNGIEISGTNLQLPASVAGDGIDLTSGVLSLSATVAGNGLDIASGVLSLSASVAGAGLTHASGVLAVGGGNGITANANDVALTDAAVTSSNPISVATGTIGFDMSSLTAFSGGSDIAGADLFLIDDGAGGTNKAISYQNFGIPVVDDATTTPFSSADLTYANKWYSCNNASAISAVIPAEASVNYPIGTTFWFYQVGAGQITVSVTTDTLNAPNGAKTAQQYSVVSATKVASATWVLSGDSTT